MNEKDWYLITGIYVSLEYFQEYFSWSMSTGELANYAEIFYNELKKGLPNNRREVQAIFEKANIYCYGEDHECDLASTDQMKILLERCYDYYSFDIDYGTDGMVNYYREVDELVKE